MSAAKQTTISPIDGSVVATRDVPSNEAVEQAIQKALTAQKAWRQTSLAERIPIVSKMLDLVEAQKEEFGHELCREMGRPIKFGAGELGGFLDRGRHLVAIAEKSLKDVSLEETDKPGLRRYLRKEPLGLIFVLSPWNYPYMTQVNILVPALLAGNAVIVKPSPQTPSSSERIINNLVQSGLPKDLAQVLHVSFDQVPGIVADPRIGLVSFTGSVSKGALVDKAAANGPGFKRVNLELGGKDAAYVRADADPAYTAAEVVDGGLFNSGQSCCAIERVYVHEKVYDAFVDEVKKVISGYKLGDPKNPEVTLGPVISKEAAKSVRAHYADAVSKGAKGIVDEKLFPESKEGTTYVHPQAFVNVNHDMLIMNEETFGPCIGIQKVSSDEEAVKLINDSQYGLTCSVWTNDEAKFLELMPQIEAGTVFQNRSDYCDPALAWTGVKDSGRGVSLSSFVYDHVTQLKSVHIKTLK